jgi:exocyst complex protein 7
MTGTFEERLTKLEENILPIYKETEDNQRLQVNVDQTLKSLDSVIDFYTIGKEVENLIRHSIYIGTV